MVNQDIINNLEENTIKDKLEDILNEQLNFIFQKIQKPVKGIRYDHLLTQ